MKPVKIEFRKRPQNINQCECVADYRIEKLQDFLSRLLEPPVEKTVYGGLSLRPPSTVDLATRYSNVMDWAAKHGDLQAAPKEK